MSFQMVIEAKSIGEGLWSATMPPEDVRRLGKPNTVIGVRTVLGVTDARSVDGSLYFGPDDVVVLNAGASSEAVVVKLGGRTAAVTMLSPPPALSPTPKPQQSVAVGDAAFVAQCRRHLSDEVATLAERLIVAIREEFPGHMHEGKARKWVNYPSNFLAITIQNRDQSLAIHVKGRPEAHPQTHLQLSRDRPGYSRFKISRLSDLASALAIIKRSAWMGAKRSK